MPFLGPEIEHHVVAVKHRLRPSIDFCSSQIVSESTHHSQSPNRAETREQDRKSILPADAS